MGNHLEGNLRLWEYKRAS